MGLFQVYPQLARTPLTAELYRLYTIRIPRKCALSFLPHDDRRFAHSMKVALYGRSDC